MLSHRIINTESLFDVPTLKVVGIPVTTTEVENSLMFIESKYLNCYRKILKPFDKIAIDKDFVVGADDEFDDTAFNKKTSRSSFSSDDSGMAFVLRINSLPYQSNMDANHFSNFNY
jgi:hypothetical protein